MCVFYIKYIIEAYQVHFKASHNEIYHHRQKTASKKNPYFCYQVYPLVHYLNVNNKGVF